MKIKFKNNSNGFCYTKCPNKPPKTNSIACQFCKYYDEFITKNKIKCNYDKEEINND